MLFLIGNNWMSKILLKCPSQLVRQLFARLCFHVIQNLRVQRQQLLRLQQQRGEIPAVGIVPVVDDDEVPTDKEDELLADDEQLVPEPKKERKMEIDTASIAASTSSLTSQDDDELIQKSTICVTKFISKMLSLVCKKTIYCSI
jgi:hypothetical protein